MATPNCFKKNDLNLQFLNIIDEELDPTSTQLISRANFQLKAIGEGIFAVNAGNIEKFRFDMNNYANLYELIDGVPTAFASKEAVLDFFFNT